MRPDSVLSPALYSMLKIIIAVNRAGCYLLQVPETPEVEEIFSSLYCSFSI